MAFWLCCHSNPQDKNGQIDLGAVKAYPVPAPEDQRPGRQCRTCAIPSFEDCGNAVSASKQDEVMTPLSDATKTLVSAPPPPAGAVNLTGVYLLTSFEGDMDKFLSEIGIGYMMRTAASAKGYGVGSSLHRISHTGNDVKIDCTGGLKTFSSCYVVGGGSQAIESQDGQVNAIPTWADDGKAISVAVTKLDGSPAPHATRSKPSEGEMIVMVTSVQGSVITQKFTKQ